MGRVTYGQMQFICRYHAQTLITIFPPELVADGRNCDRIARGRCFLNEGNYSCCRHEQCDHDENGNDRPRQFHLTAAVNLGRFSTVVIPLLSEPHDGVKQQGEDDQENGSCDCQHKQRQPEDRLRWTRRGGKNVRRA